MIRPGIPHWARRRALAAVVLSGVAAVAGCGDSPNPALYTIAPVPGAERSGSPRVIVLQQVAIARYLDRTPIVRSAEGYRVDVLANDWWGEPLPAMLSRVLVEELGQRLPQSTVLGEGGAVSARPDATLELNVQRLDRDATGAVLLQAQASLTVARQAAPVLRSFRFTVPVSGPDTAAQVAAISTAVGQLADGLADLLARARTPR
jgi:uncharacterized lipoprotein YmbA